jgi:signal transduction histidine kinase
VWEDLRGVEARSLTGRQDDQRRIAAELHDGLGQDLTGMSLLLRAARDRAGEPEVRNDLQKIEQLLRGAIDTCRRLAREQAAFGFIHGNLRESLQHFLKGINEISNVSCALQWPANLTLHDRAIEYNLYRIAQEAVTNAVRHSGAHQITVHVLLHDGNLRLEIEDDGTGLQEGNMSEGVGMETMRYRAGTIRGRLEITPRTPAGLTVRCEVPLPKCLSRRGNKSGAEL